MESTKTCKGCGAEFPLESFPVVQNKGKTERITRCRPCYRVYKAESLRRWRAGVRLTQDAEADLIACVSVLVHYHHKFDEDCGSMLANAAQLIECALYLLEEPSHEKKQKHWSSVG